MPRSKDLLDKSIRAAGWGYLGSIVRLVVQILAQIVLARLLGPNDYGLFAIGVILVSLTFLFSDVASSALIQMKTVNERQLRFALFCQLSVGLLATMVLVGLAHPLSLAMDQPRCEAVIYALAPVCFLNALGGVALAQLRRALAYGIIQFAQTAGYFVGYILVAIPLAVWFDAGVWALVSAWMVQAALTSLLYWRNAPHSLLPSFSCPESEKMIAFGVAAMVANFSNWALSNVDRLIVAKFSPLAETGLYTTSMNLLSTPLAQILGTFQSVTFSASARMEDEVDEKLFLSLLGVVSLITWSMYGFALAISGTLISALYGPKWVGAVPYMTAFCVSLAAFGTMSAITPLLWGRGAVRREALPQFWMAAVLTLVAWFAVKESSLAVAWSVATVSILRCVWMIRNGLRTFNATTGAVVSLLFRIGVFVFVLSALCFTADHILKQCISNPLSRLPFDILALLIIIAIGIIFRRRWFGNLLTDVLDPLLHAVSTRIGLRVR